MEVAVAPFERVVRPGKVPGFSPKGRPTPLDVFVKIEWDGDRLSIAGVEGPRPNGNAWGSCGQIAMGYAHRDPADNDPRERDPKGLEEFADGWDAERWFDLLDAWKRWHLNDMQSACEHQRALGWTYDTHLDERRCPRCNSPLEKQRNEDGEWLRCPACFFDADRTIEPPPGYPYAGLPCPECGHRIGSAWLREDVPSDVLEFLLGLPEADRSPAWV